MNIASLIETSDAWKADLLALPDVVVSQVAVSAAQIVFPQCRCSELRALMPGMLQWRHQPSVESRNGVVASIYRYCYDSGLFGAGGAAFLEFPVSRWPVAMNEDQEVLAEDCVLEAANSIATLGEKSFFGIASSCLRLAEDCYEISSGIAFRESLARNLRGQTG